MKKNTILIILLLITGFSLNAQIVPQGIKYQAVARSLKGEVMADEKINLKVSLTAGDSKSVFYTEVHSITTNELGLFSLVIGNGKTEKGSFQKVPWAEDEVWMEVSIMEKGSPGYTTISNSKLLAVPYALHAGTANNLVNGKANNGNEVFQAGGVPAQVWSLKGNSGTDPGDKLGTTDLQDFVIVTDNTERLTIASDGNIAIKNDLDIDKDLLVKNNLNVNQFAYLNTAGGSTIAYGPFNVANDQPTYLSGSLSVKKYTSLQNSLTVYGVADFNDQLTVKNQKPTLLTGALTTDQGVTFKNTLSVAGAADFYDQLKVNSEKPTQLTGKLTVEKNSDLLGQVNIKVPLSNIQQTDFEKYPLKVEGTTQGIGIKLTTLNPSGQPNESNNYITFFNEAGDAKGRIEGQRDFIGLGYDIYRSLIQLPKDTIKSSDPNRQPSTNEPPPQPIADLLTSNYALELIPMTADFIAEVIKLGANIAPALLSLGTLGDVDDIFWSGVELIVQNYEILGYIAFNEAGAGVAFESGGADYAEWLPQADELEKLTFGDVVGVKGGRISKSFDDAEKFMVVSHSPVIIGGMPEENDKAVYEKIAFMGQVPVKVVGRAQRGDYILPNGSGDGMAIAVHPSQMLAKDYRRIVGIAWSDADTTKMLNYINTAVGINHNDLAGLVEQMQIAMNNMQQTLASLSPDYKPSYFNVAASEKRVAGVEYSTGPTLKSQLTANIKTTNFESPKEALQVAKQYASANGVDFSMYPMLNDLFDNPTPEQVEKVIDYYSKALVRLQSISLQAQQARAAGR